MRKMTSLNIVAHPDDDLLFLNPDIIGDLLNDQKVGVIYLTAGDDGNSEEYVYRRKRAIRSAYNNGLGDFTYFFYDIKSSCHRLGESYGQLYQMYQDRSFSGKTILDQQLTAKMLIEQIQSDLEWLKPDLIRVQDPDAEPAIDHDEPHFDHIDHIYGAKFALEAVSGFNLPIYVYTGYPIRYQEDNVDSDLANKKLEMWRKYQEIDTSVSGTVWDIAISRCYKRQIQ